jgi:hypothetical protein
VSFLEAVNHNKQQTERNANMQYRQGDVLIELVQEIPRGLKAVARENGKVVLAHGEATGHAHAIADKGCKLLHDESGVTFLEVKQDMAMLRHEEHATVQLERGKYRVTRQREYSPEAIRNVAD